MPRVSPDPPLYEQVASQLAALIRSGTLRAGQRLPSVRRAGVQHGVGIATAVRAYRLLEDRGLITPRAKSGFYVRARPLATAEPAPARRGAASTQVGVASLQARLFDAARRPEVIPFGAAYPSADYLPAAQLARLLAGAARRELHRGISYDMPPGWEPLRREIARQALESGAHLSPDDLITTSGGTEALSLCLRAVTQPGDIVAIETPTYFGLLQIIEELRLRVVEIPMQAQQGMNLDALERALARQRIAACVAVPNFSNPLGSLMPAAHQQRLVEMLGGRGVPLIEDDINGELIHEGSRPGVAFRFDRENLVLLCGSFSKTLAPGYRVGWVVPGRYGKRVKAMKLTSTLATATLPQMAVAEFLASGAYGRHLRTLRARFAEGISRMTEAVQAHFPPNIRVTRPQGGFVLWVELPRRVSALELHERALRENISIAPGPMFSARQSFPNFVRLNAGHPWSAAREQALHQLGHLIRRMS